MLTVVCQSYIKQSIFIINQPAPATNLTHMKKVLFTLIIAMSFVAVKAQFRLQSINIDSLIACTPIPDCGLGEAESKPCFNDEKIKTSDKHFYIPFFFRGKDGLLHTGCTGRSFSHGVPNEAFICFNIAQQAHILPSDVHIGIISEISCTDYHAFFKGKYGKIIMNK